MFLIWTKRTSDRTFINGSTHWQTPCRFHKTQHIFHSSVFAVSRAAKQNFTWLLGMRLGGWCLTDRETLSGCCFKTVIVPLLLCLMHIKVFPHSACISALLAAGMSVPAWPSYLPFTWLCSDIIRILFTSWVPVWHYTSHHSQVLMIVTLPNLKQVCSLYCEHTLSCGI